MLYNIAYFMLYNNLDVIKYPPYVLKPLTDESRHKLRSTENFIDAIKTIQIPDDHKLVSFDVKSAVFHFNWP